jgi:hypothetical protein
MIWMPSLLARSITASSRRFEHSDLVHDLIKLGYTFVTSSASSLPVRDQFENPGVIFLFRCLNRA